MCMIPKQCEDCLNEITVRSNKVFADIIEKTDNKLASIDDKSTIHYANMEQRYEKHLEANDRRENKKFNRDYIIIAILVLIFAYTYVRQDQLNERITISIKEIEATKANKEEVLSKNESYQLQMLNDSYDLKVFAKSNNARIDTSDYYFAKRNIFSEFSIYRGSTDLTEIKDSNN